MPRVATAIKAVPVAERGPEGPNPYLHLNLPWDYPTLSGEGKHKARINGIMLQGPDPKLFVRAWVLFRTHYLQQLSEGVFYKTLAPSPPIHYHAVEDLARYSLNAWAFPRGSGKSTVLGKEIPMFLALTRPRFDLTMILAKDDFVRKRFSQFMEMFEDNSFIIDDFGKIKPPRGAKVWNHHLLQLSNGAQLYGMPVEGKMLGERPDLILPDDPEHDKSMVANPNPKTLADSFERLLFGTLMPMLQEGACLGWIGTLLSIDSFLYYVINSKDPKFDFWNRRCIAGLDDSGNSFWKDRWTPAALEKMRQMWGEEYFQTHMQNRPGASTDKALVLNTEYCTYEIEDEDEELVSYPLASQALLVSRRPVRTGKGEEIRFSPEDSRRPFGQTVSNMYRMMTVDFAFTVTERSDFSAVQVMGFENTEDFHDTMWCLDSWIGKESSASVVQRILALARKWQVRLIGVEAVTIQKQLVEMVATGVESMENEGKGIIQVVPIRYPSNLRKEERIANLEWRFSKFRIKLPWQKKREWPWRETFREIEAFNPGNLGRMGHDDALDALAMYQFVGRPRSRWAHADPGEAAFDPVALLKKGEVHDQHGISLMSGLSANEIPVEELRKHRDPNTETEENISWSMGGSI